MVETHPHLCYSHPRYDMQEAATSYMVADVASPSIRQGHMSFTNLTTTVADVSLVTTQLRQTTAASARVGEWSSASFGC